MKTRIAGGPAFPVNAGALYPDGGLSYLDYAAIEAMKTILAERIRSGATGWDAGRAEGTVQQRTAKCAYVMAEAMLAERERREARGDND